MRSVKFAMVQRCVLFAFTGCVTFGCEPKKTPPAHQSTPTSAGSSQPADNTHLDRSAVAVIEQIASLETKKDVTCWTSFRQLDNFIATKPYSEHATLAKIAASKQLARTVWELASAQKRSGSLSAQDIQAVLKLEDATLSEGLEREGMTELATQIGMRDYTDYRKTSEHWRVLLSVLHDAILLNRSELLELSPQAAEALADLVTRHSLRLLRSSGDLATQDHAPTIEARHVRKAHETLMSAHGLKDAALTPPARARMLGPEQIAQRLAPLTQRLILAKVEALTAFNKQADRLAAINRVSRLPIEPEALEVFARALRSFSFFVSQGFEPMRHDNFLSDGSFASGKLSQRAYLDAVWTENVVMQIFPHVMMPNGDIALRFEPNPGTLLKEPVEPFELLMLDHEQNGVRDSAIHWATLAQVYEDKAFAMDPFAAEYLSEVGSMMMTLFIKRAERLARSEGLERITAAVASRAQDSRHVMVFPQTQRAHAWSEEQQQAKERALSGYTGSLFEDVTAAAGLPTTVARLEADLEVSGVRSDIQRVMGSGVAVGDLNGDDLPDLFVAGEGLGRLYINGARGTPGAFEDRTGAYGLPEGMHDSRGALFFDHDGDGDLDLMVTRSGHPSALFSWDGARFEDVTEKVGIATQRGAHVPHVFDYDGDGDLDLFVGYYGAHEVNAGRSRERNLPSVDGRNSSPAQLWRREASGTYVEVAQAAGVADTGWTLAASSFDYDQDGDMDLYLANDFGANSFYANRGDATFEDRSAVTGTADRGSGMNVSFADVDQDGWLDFFVTNIDMFSKSIKIVFPRDDSLIPLGDEVLQSFQYLTGNKLYLGRKGQAGERTFEAAEQRYFEPGDQGWAWDGNFFDYELDGDEDLYIANGWIEGSYANKQANRMYIRHADLFYLAHEGGAESFKDNSRAVASVDVDRDGDLDLVVTNLRGAPRLLKNTQASKNHWAGVRLRQPGMNTRALGARVVLTSSAGAQVRLVTGGRGYLSQDDPDRVVFGLGTQTRARVKIFWPDGTSSDHDVEAGKVLDIKKP